MNTYKSLFCFFLLGLLVIHCVADTKETNSSVELLVSMNNEDKLGQKQQLKLYRSISDNSISPLTVSVNLMVGYQSPELASRQIKEYREKSFCDAKTGVELEAVLKEYQSPFDCVVASNDGDTVLLAIISYFGKMSGIPPAGPPQGIRLISTKEGLASLTYLQWGIGYHAYLLNLDEKTGRYHYQSHQTWPWPLGNSISSEAEKTIMNTDAVWFMNNVGKTPKGGLLAFGKGKLNFRGIVGGPGSPMTPYMPIAYPLCPYGIACLNSDEKNSNKLDIVMPFNTIKAMGLKDISNEECLEFIQKNQQYTVRKYWDLSSIESSPWKGMAAKVSYMSIVRDYLFAKWQKTYFTGEVGANGSSSEQVMASIQDFFKNNSISFEELYGTKSNKSELLTSISNNPNVRFKHAVSEWIRAHNSNTDQCTASDEEIKSFYENYKWSFRKTPQKDSPYYKLDEVRDYIADEIKRLKYYRSESLLTKPLEVKIDWGKNNDISRVSKSRQLRPGVTGIAYTLDELKKLGGFSEEEWKAFKKTLQNKAVQSGNREYIETFLQTMGSQYSREEMKQKLRLWVSQHSGKPLFSQEEIEQILKEPDDYTTIKDPLKRFHAYDWYGRFKEAHDYLAAQITKESSEPDPRFFYELGVYCFQGRPGLTQDSDKALEFLQKARDLLKKKKISSFDDISQLIKTLTPDQRILTIKVNQALLACPQYKGQDKEVSEFVIKNLLDIGIAEKQASALYLAGREEVSLVGRSGNATKGWQLLKQAAAQNDSDAKILVAFLAIYRGQYDGYSSEKKIAEAKQGLEVIKQAILQQSNLAQLALGCLYTHNLPALGEENKSQATLWLKRSSDRGSTEAKELLDKLNKKI